VSYRVSRRVVGGYLHQLLTPHHYDRVLALLLLVPLVPFSIFERAWSLAATLATLSLTWLWLTMWRPPPTLAQLSITSSSERLHLRPPRVGEEHDLERIASQPGNVMAHGRIDPHKRPRPTIRQRLRRRRVGHFVWMTSVLVILDQRFAVIGDVSARQIIADPLTFEVGLVLDQEHVDRGYGTEALAAAVSFWRQGTAGPVLRAATSVDNVAAIAVLSRVGFEQIAETERTLGNGTVIDAAIFEHRSRVPDQLIPTISGATSFDLTPQGWI
jgi:RimJ/RimL family protein N-acetyltransferase